ncbi:S1C family serine protease [Ideonella sp. DXS22W]|uniref:S1C family serine protease n=1 Tax=Pseudaquabacterium inlustre TaxID=2984192 RepID=A0ABU9CIS3_9BURK
MSRRLAPTTALAALAALTALAMAAIAGPARALTPAELFAQVAPSVWRVQTFDRDGLPLGQGSGVVTGFAELVTNCHVLAKAQRVQIRRDGLPQPLPARLARWDVQRDLCQLSVPGLTAPAVRLGRADQATVGQAAYTVGHPKGLDLTLAAGLVSSIRRNDAGQLVLLQTSAAISGGSSGGALFNEQGELLGLTTLGIFGGDSQNLNFAIPAEWILDLPRRHEAARAAARAAAAASR